uniref:Uncharacterized protein n=1 Tax=Aegilops tauschii subsp. strangulata TaxID=200361 RepID=A0A453B5J2_AEGTS
MDVTLVHHNVILLHGSCIVLITQVVPILLDSRFT